MKHSSEQSNPVKDLIQSIAVGPLVSTTSTADDYDLVFISEAIRQTAL